MPKFDITSPKRSIEAAIRDLLMLVIEKIAMEKSNKAICF